MPSMPAIMLVALLSGALVACTAAQSPGPASAAHRYRDPAGDFQIDVPADIEIRHDFARDYFSAGAWKAYAPADSQGEARLALMLPGSNAITRAELRIGISGEPRELARCTVPPANAVPGSLGRRRLDAVAFTHFRAGDAAMSHYMDVDAYRAVHDGRCYAIDLLIAGTRPEVYSPPATPPFSRQWARQRLDALLAGFTF